MLWGWGFLAIYRRPLSRITASRVDLRQRPRGQRHRERALGRPAAVLRIDGQDGFKPCGLYYGLTLVRATASMQMYWRGHAREARAALPVAQRGRLSRAFQQPAVGLDPAAADALPDDHASITSCCSRASWASSRSRALHLVPDHLRHPVRRHRRRGGVQRLRSSRGAHLSARRRHTARRWRARYFDQIDLENTHPDVAQAGQRRRRPRCCCTPEEARAAAGGRHLVARSSTENSLGQPLAGSVVAGLAAADLELLGLIAFPLAFVALRGLARPGLRRQQDARHAAAGLAELVRPEPQARRRISRWWIALCLRPADRRCRGGDGLAPASC